MFTQRVMSESSVREGAYYSLALLVLIFNWCLSLPVHKGAVYVSVFVVQEEKDL